MRAVRRACADDLQRDAEREARQLPWEAIASPDALRAAGLEDAAAGMAAILRAYVLTLPRVLALVACCRR